MSKLRNCAVAALCCAALTPFAHATPQMRATITVSGYSGSAPLENFPVLVRISEEGITGFHYADCAAGGMDVAFEDANGNALAREIDTWNTSGESLVWVRLPVLTNNASFALTYRDPSVAAQPACQTDGSVWTAAGYVGVWHMTEASGTVADATAHGLTATPGGSYTANSIAVAGKIGNARQNAASADKPGNLVVPNYDSFNVGNTFAVGGWFYLTDNSSSDNRFFSRKETYTESGGWEIMHKGGQSSLSNRKINVRGKTNSKTITSSGLDIAGTGWNHFLFVYNGTSATVYRNGEALTTSGTIEAATDNGQTMGIGSYRVAAASCIVGNIDECRLLDALPTADWVKAEFAQGHNASFLTYGAAELVASGDILAIMGSPSPYGSPTPAYGQISGLSAGNTRDLSMPATAVADTGSATNFLIGWSLASMDIGTGVRTVIRTSSDAGESIDAYHYTHAGFAEFTWLWETRYAAAVSSPRLTGINADSLSLELDVAGLGYSGEPPALTLAYGTAANALLSTETVSAALANRGTFTATIDDLEPGTCYFVKTVLSLGGVVLAESAVESFETMPQMDGSVIFLKEDATGANNGTCWADAFTTWEEAMAAVRAEGSDAPVTLMVAKGIYVAPSSDPNASWRTAVTNASFAILGGCRAAYRNDVFRDPETYQTIITTWSKSSVKSAYWKRRTPIGEQYTYADENVTSGGANFTILDANERLQLPAFTGEHDTFIASGGGGHIPIFIAAGAGGVIDGLRFVCCHRGSNRAGLINIGSGAGDILVTNCVFAGCGIQSAAVEDNAGTATGSRRTVVDCKVLFCTFEYGTVGVSSAGNMTVRNCEFIGNSQRFEHNNDSICPLSLTGDGCIAEDCLLTRNFICIGSTGKAMLLEGPAAFRRITATNNYAIAKNVKATSLISLRNGRYIGAGILEDSLVADNTMVVQPCQDFVAVMVTGHTTDRDSAPVILDTVFRDNSIVAYSNSLSAAQSCALGIVGNASCDSKAMWMSVLGCVFDSNRAEVLNLCEGATPVLSRGILSYASSTSKMQYGLANCTFLGPAIKGLYDFAQFGSHVEPQNIVNCVFSLDNPDIVATPFPNAVAEPFFSQTPETINLFGCAVQNWYAELIPAGLGTVAGLKYDPIPFEWILAPQGGGIPRPAAWTPGLRETCDIATNGPPASSENSCNRQTFAFREHGEVTWRPLVPRAPGTLLADPEPVTDILGATRPFGATTAGAVQSLSPVAESGSTLTLRRDPFGAGVLSVPFVQAAAAGASYAPVKATPTGDAEFLGWRDIAGNPFSASNPLVLDAPPTNLTLVASFGTPTVSITFIIPEHGTFDSNGLSSITMEEHAGRPFPEIPAYTIDDGYVFASWDNDFPSLVPYENMTFRAKVVTTSVRRLHAAPDGTGDGSSWANAASLAAAYEEAAAYRGEVWLKAGTYVLTAPLTPRSNVAVIGGFAGGETSAAEANPLANPTFISGNASGDLYWKPNGTDPGVAYRTNVWDGTALNPPNPGWADKYWQPASPSALEDATYAFFDDIGNTATNTSFSGVTFTGFGCSALYSVAGTGNSFTFENCRFVANGTRASSVETIHVNGSFVSLRDCDFIGNYRVARITVDSSSVANVIENCRFIDNSGGALNLAATTGAFEVVHCEIARNYNYEDSNPAAMKIALSSPPCIARVSDCVVSSNRTCANSGNNGNVTLSVTTGSNQSPNLVFERCDFIDNLGEKTRAVVILSSGGVAGSIQLRDCLFARNDLVTPQGGNPPIGGIIYNMTSSVMTFVNCLFEGNHAYAPSGAGVVLANDGWRNSAFLHCTFAGNDISADDPNRAADFCVVEPSGGKSQVLVNCVFDETGSGHWPIRANGGSVNIWSVFTRGQATNDFGAAAFNIRGHSSANPMVHAGSVPGPNGRVGRPLSAFTPAGTGMPIQLATDGNYYVFEAWKTGEKDKPWTAPYIKDLTVQQAEALGLSLEADAIPDIWGQPRPAGKPIYCGHINATKAGFRFILR